MLSNSTTERVGLSVIDGELFFHALYNLFNIHIIFHVIQSSGPVATVSIVVFLHTIIIVKDAWFHVFRVNEAVDTKEVEAIR